MVGGEKIGAPIGPLSPGRASAQIAVLPSPFPPTHMDRPAATAVSPHTDRLTATAISHPTPCARITLLLPPLRKALCPTDLGTMGSVGFPLKLSACILFFLILEKFCVIYDSHWCYDKPECEPGTWGTIGFCGGTRQSSINIELNKMHLVHTKNNMSLEDAKKDPEGLLVLAFFMQVEKMTNSLYFTTIQENRRMQNNFRFVQPLNGRKVYYYQEVKTLGSCLQMCFSIIF
ncbi:carbonic anhydrase 4-like [Crotalus adamanteus]|uniref:Carbonic anhydrase 4-like n=1 Tax=Crotalus adamanteus TaxID=8729 RepID=A0AAW1B760_CROAD